MKRVLFLLVLLMTVSAVSFAQKKNVRAARAAAGTTGTDFNKAQELIDEALKNPETMNDANTWNVAGYIQQRINGEEAKRILLGQAYDTVKYNNSLLKMFEYFKKCDDIAQVPDEKGKIKNKYRKANAETLLKERSNLINGGVYHFNNNRNNEALQFFSTYVESASYPMLAEQNLQQTDTLYAQIAYYATLAASKANNQDAIIKYAPIAMNDKDNGRFAIQLLADAYKAKGDTVAWTKALEAGVVKYPEDDYFFANLIDYYNNSNQTTKAIELVDKMLASNANNKLYLYVKGYLYYNIKDYDNAIEFFKKAIAVDPQYVEAYQNIGLSYLLKAQDYSTQAPTDRNDPKYAESQSTLKKFYEEAKVAYEKVRALKPDQKDLWLQGLYRVYYNLDMGPEFEEIEKLMEQK